MIYITGDTHGNQYKWAEQIEPVLKPGDTMIVCGDFGVGFWNGRFWSQETFFDHLAEQPYTVLFVDGNHEDFDYLDALPVTRWNGGRVHRLRPNLLHLMRGEVYTVEDKTWFVFGGGYSIDRAWRVEHQSWWPRELPDQAEYDHALTNLERVGNQVDFILTHTAPGDTVQYLSTMRDLQMKYHVTEEVPLNGFLDTVQRQVAYRRWYFGHFHQDLELWRNQILLLSTVRELETGRVVRRWKPYEG